MLVQGACAPRWNNQVLCLHEHIALKQCATDCCDVCPPACGAPRGGNRPTSAALDGAHSAGERVIVAQKRAQRKGWPSRDGRYTANMTAAQGD